METHTKCKQSNYMTPNTPNRMDWNNGAVVTEASTEQVCVQNMTPGPNEFNFKVTKGEEMSGEIAHGNL